LALIVWEILGEHWKQSEVLIVWESLGEHWRHLEALVVFKILGDFWESIGNTQWLSLSGRVWQILGESGRALGTLRGTLSTVESREDLRYSKLLGFAMCLSLYHCFFFLWISSLVVAELGSTLSLFHLFVCLFGSSKIISTTSPSRFTYAYSNPSNKHAHFGWTSPHHA
jgi:hypothetical protein